MSRFRTAVAVAVSYPAAGLVAYPVALAVSLPVNNQLAFPVFLTALVAVMYGLLVAGDLLIYGRRTATPATRKDRT